MSCAISYVCCIWLWRGHSSFHCFIIFFPSSLWNLFHTSCFFFFTFPFLSLHRSFLCPGSQFSPLIWPGLTQDFSFWAHTARHCGKSTGVNDGTGRGIDGGARERGVGGALRKHSICCFFPKPRFSPEDERTEGRGWWKRKWENLCCPPNPQTAVSLASIYHSCKHKYEQIPLDCTQ